MNGLKGLLGSDKGVFAILVLVCATVLLALGKITPELWAGVTGANGIGYQIAKGWQSAARERHREPEPPRP